MFYLLLVVLSYGAPLIWPCKTISVWVFVLFIDLKDWVTKDYFSLAVFQKSSQNAQTGIVWSSYFSPHERITLEHFQVDITKLTFSKPSPLTTCHTDSTFQIPLDRPVLLIRMWHNGGIIGCSFMLTLKVRWFVKLHKGDMMPILLEAFWHGSSQRLVTGPTSN